MKIRWLGHSCFLITNLNGIRILTDPYNEKVGYGKLKVSADIVTISHGHFDHSYSEGVGGQFTLLNQPGHYSANGITITGTAVFHDEAGGARRGSNVIFTFEVDGIRLCHCGDLGHVLTVRQLESIGHTDVLFLPVGGTYTIDADEAVKVRKQLKPMVTIPMHYRTKACEFPIDGVDRFLNAAGGGIRAGKTEIELNQGGLGGDQMVMVLDYKEQTVP